MAGAKRKHSADPKRVLRPYFEVRSDEPEARDALNTLVGFDVWEAEKRGWAWINSHAPTGWNEPDASGQSGEVTKARALAAELTGTLGSVKSMFGPERSAGRRWNDALDNLVQSLEAFLPFAQVRRREASFFASRVSPGGRAHYDAVLAGTVKLGAIARNMAVRARIAQTKITTYKDDPLPGLAKTKPHRKFLAQICARLSLAGFTFNEIGDILPDPLRLTEEFLEASYLDSTKTDEPAKVQENLKMRRERYRNDHAERIRYLVSGVKGEIVQARASAALVNAALEGFMKRTGKGIRDAATWFDEYIESEGEGSGG